MFDPIEVVERQSEIIQLQSRTINDLFQLLKQHMAASEYEATLNDYQEKYAALQGGTR